MSDAWMTTYDAVFFISCGTLLCGFLSLVVKYSLKSKCEHCNICFGLLSIDRRVDLEVQEEIQQMQLDHQDNNQKKDTENNLDN